ncbi:hypothetical protein C8A01DRAFT_51396 [Parachaetomium inaequale]|uniref:Uncharacterized protein n=1 Tax=Parachaetomium inaequale TaxID=2588326 RepID=A0AAN6P4R3_9PEZI|nr:hypothetical protein C8A01DRAFT_51396 [Parachaetomium inaequale]
MTRLNPSSLGLNFTSKTHCDTYTAIDPATDPALYTGKIVLITGAAKGIGCAIVVLYTKAGAMRITITAWGNASWGYIDILVNNAGYLVPFVPLGKGDKVLGSMDKTIVNVTSVGALVLTLGTSVYQTSKLAVLRLSEYLIGLIVYSVYPVSVVTDLATVCNDTPELAGDSIVYLTSKRREWLAGRYVSCAWDMLELIGREYEIVERNLLKLQMNF